MVASAVVLALALSAFEFPGCAGRASGMLAGAAVADGQHAFFLNPALIAADSRYQAGACCSRPYDLPGLSWGRVSGNWSSELVAAGVGFSALRLGQYGEQDAQVVVGGAPMRSLSVGLGIHALIVSDAPDYSDIVPAFDAGVCWRSGRVRVGAAGLRLNSPRWRDGTELPSRIVLAGSWHPVDEVLLATDLSRQQGEDDVTFGAEFRPVPQFGLRMGIGVAPLRYAAGLGATVGPVGFEYAYQFHPQLKETHILGLRAAWR
ncbi:MAG TPA: hypothetical protein VMH22_05005 [bacterium]|nr:hypothetical protein [bacterium]